MNAKPKILVDNILNTEDNETTLTTSYTSGGSSYTHEKMFDWHPLTKWKPGDSGTNTFTLDLNLVVNMSFEEHTSGDPHNWELNGGYHHSSSKQSGTYAVAVQGNGGTRVGVISDPILINVDSTYIMHIYYNVGVTSGSCGMKLQYFRDTAGTSMISESAYVLEFTESSGGIYNRGVEVGYGTSYTTPAGTKSIRIKQMTQCAQGDDFYLDDVLFYEKQTIDAIGISGHNLSTSSTNVMIEHCYHIGIGVFEENSYLPTTHDLIDNIVVNGDFELWSSGTGSAPDNWTVDTAVLKRENYGWRNSGGQIQLTGVGTAYQDLPASCAGKKIFLKAFAYSFEADRARASIYHNGTGAGYTYTDYFGKVPGGRWEVIEAEKAIPSDATVIRIYLHSDEASQWALFDDVQAVALTPHSDDKTLVKSFTTPVVGARGWRITIEPTGSAIPEISHLALGTSLEMEKYPLIGFDPSREKIKSKGASRFSGQLLIPEVSYYERQITASFTHLTSSWVDTYFIPLWHSHLKQLKPFFWVWDGTNHPDEAYLVHMLPGASLSMPYDPIYRSITLNMRGLVE